MPTTPPIILSLDPGTKEIGVAVFCGRELCYYAVKTLRCRRPPEALLAEISRMVTEIIARYAPQELALEGLSRLQARSALVRLAARNIQQTARRAGLAVYVYAPAEVRRKICQRENATKRATAARLVVRFPELARYHEPATRWGALYWAHMFAAVAVGWLHGQEVYGTEDPR